MSTRAFSESARPAATIQWIGVLSLLLTLPLGLFAQGLPLPWLAVPLLLSIVVLGLPHGALDHQAAGRIWGLRSLAAILGFYGAYLFVAAIYLAVWFILPGLAFALFLVLTVFHWGQGDHWFEAVTCGGARGKTGPARNALTIFVRGGIPILLPLVAFPEVVARIASGAIGLFPAGGGNGLGWFAFLLQPGARAAIGIVLGVAILVNLAILASECMRVQRRGQSGRGPAAALLELVVLTLYFATLHPLLAIGVYFCAWHSLRHLYRLRYFLAPAGQAHPRSWRAIIVNSLPLTLASVGILVVLGIYFAQVVGINLTIQAFIGLYLVLLAILTLPHAMVVTAMDRREGPGSHPFHFERGSSRITSEAPSLALSRIKTPH
jgi:Brp/Blh family beta-carotene 15,15'-monooxygenase